MKNNLLNWIKNNDLWAFFVLVFALMWPKGIAGAAYSFKHLPSFFTKGTDHYGMPFLWFLMTIVSISILMVWIMNHTNQSGLMTILFHSGYSV